MTYVHRIGRTARAGAQGTAVTLVDWDDIPRWKLICDKLDLPFHEPVETYSSSPHLTWSWTSRRRRRARCPAPSAPAPAWTPRSSRISAAATRAPPRPRSGDQRAEGQAARAAGPPGAPAQPGPYPRRPAGRRRSPGSGDVRRVRRGTAPRAAGAAAAAAVERVRRRRRRGLSTARYASIRRHDRTRAARGTAARAPTDPAVERYMRRLRPWRIAYAAGDRRRRARPAGDREDRVLGRRDQPRHAAHGRARAAVRSRSRRPPDADALPGARSDTTAIGTPYDGGTVVTLRRALGARARRPHRQGHLELHPHRPHRLHRGADGERDRRGLRAGRQLRRAHRPRLGHRRARSGRARSTRTATWSTTRSTVIRTTRSARTP